MHVQVSGHQLDVGDALRTHAIDKLTNGVSKYYDRPVEATVVFGKDGYEYRANCVLHLSSGLVLKVEGRSTDVYASFEAALDRLEKRLRRYKRRLKNHNNHVKSPLPVENVPSFIISAREDDEEEEHEDAQPVIIAEETTSIPSLSVGDAVMQMDISDAPFVIFRNQASGRINFVHKRPDGHIGWIETGADRGTV